ncbi:hypothetical protein MA16_Dca019097 [Dendrobium catenatum]|uniref:Uncharacterized protein n=1 Tax=Dendrobium catenatum TaxID=906689 RepID=A0A2I0WPA2_9ASPA|nr:hypothetical protein MA16_Dca019097 [Dendrobium catenatum]
MREDRGGRPPNVNVMEDFNSMINSCHLNDIGYFGNPFTWNRTNLWQRLDIILFNNDWLNSFPLTHVEHLSRATFDHAPLLLCINANRNIVPASFRFQNMWLSHKDFSNVINYNWSAPIAPNNNISGMHRLWAKLNRLKQVLRWWNKNVFKNIFSNIKDAEQEVTDLEKGIWIVRLVIIVMPLMRLRRIWLFCKNKRKLIGSKRLLLN